MRHKKDLKIAVKMNALVGEDGEHLPTWFIDFSEIKSKKQPEKFPPLPLPWQNFYILHVGLWIQKVVTGKWC